MPNQAAFSVAGLKVKLGGTDILTSVDLHVEPGDLYGLLGRNGAGKTTSLRCILGYLPSAKGDCRVFGVPGHSLHLCPVPIGVALDPPGLDDTLTVRQNLQLAVMRGGISGGRSVDEVLELVGLTHRQHNRGDRLSHGQGRRAAVARALLGSPQLLVLDEPLSGLDPEGVEMLIELFRHLSLNEGVTVVLSSHHLREVQDVCTRVGMIEGGVTVLEGETRQLLAEAGDGLRIQLSGLEASQPSVIESLLTSLRAREYVLNFEHRGAGLFHGRLQSSADFSKLLAELIQDGFSISEFTPLRATLMDVFRQALEPSKT